MVVAPERSATLIIKLVVHGKIVCVLSRSSLVSWVVLFIASAEKSLRSTIELGELYRTTSVDLKTDIVVNVQVRNSEMGGNEKKSEEIRRKEKTKQEKRREEKCYQVSADFLSSANKREAMEENIE